MPEGRVIVMGKPSIIDSLCQAATPDDEKVVFGNMVIDRMTVHAAVALLVSVFVAFTFYLKMSPPEMLFSKDAAATPTVIRVQNNAELLAKLKELELWDLSAESDVAKVVFVNFPQDINSLDAKLKKKVFFHTLLPVAVSALAEVADERKMLLNILEKFGDDVNDLVFTADYASWGRRLTLRQINFILELSRKYRTPQAVTLLNRVNIVPVSLILAQGAIESSWGSSRFAQMGNNLFGIWTWGEKGIVPTGRDEGKRHKIASYPSMLESVRAYVVCLNRLPAYRNLRKIRQFSLDSSELAEGLLYYSEKREKYVWEIQKIIRQNKLKWFDEFQPGDKRVFQSKEYIQLVSARD